MKYISTRGDKTERRFCDILLEGLAPDGGLYLPAYPQVDGATLARWRGLAYADLAFEILSLYIDDIPAADLKALCARPTPPRSSAARPSCRCAAWVTG
jgi:threonine synthase